MSGETAEDETTDDEPDHPTRSEPRVHPVVATLGAYSWQLIAIAAVTVGVIWLLGELRVVVIPAAIALLVTRVLEPFAARLRARRWRPGLAATAVLVAFFAAIALVAALILPAVVDQFEDLGPTLSQAVDDVERWLVRDAPFDISEEDIDKAREQVVDRLGELLRSPDGSLAGATRLLVEIPTGGLLALLLTFFMIKDGDRLLAWTRHRMVPPRRRELADAAARSGWEAMGAFLRGAALLGTVEGVILGLAVFVVGGELVVPVAVLTFAAAFVPILGAISAGIVTVLVTLVTAGFTPALIVAVVAIVVQQLDNDLLAPVIYGKLLRIHPAAILIGVVAGGALFGVVGTLFAVPVLVAIIAIGTTILSHVSTPSDHPPAA